MNVKGEMPSGPIINSHSQICLYSVFRRSPTFFCFYWKEHPVLLHVSPQGGNTGCELGTNSVLRNLPSLCRTFSILLSTVGELTWTEGERPNSDWVTESMYPCSLKPGDACRFWSKTWWPNEDYQDSGPPCDFLYMSGSKSETKATWDTIHTEIFVGICPISTHASASPILSNLSHLPISNCCSICWFQPSRLGSSIKQCDLVLWDLKE
jgi:hypothetical protein